MADRSRWQLTIEPVIQIAASKCQRQADRAREATAHGRVAPNAFKTALVPPSAEKGERKRMQVCEGAAELSGRRAMHSSAWLDDPVD